MKVRSLVAVAVVVGGLGAPVATHAAPAATPTPTNVLFSKSKMVKLTLRNDSGSPLELKAGDQVLSLDAGKSLAIKLPVGMRILVNSATPTHKAGELLAETSTAMDNSTIAIR